MGDTESPTGVQPDYSRQGAPAPLLASEPSSQPIYYTQAAVDHSTSVPVAQQPYPNAHHAFSSQLDMSQPQGPGRPGPSGPYNMSAMANNLPPASYRPSQYSQGPQRYAQVNVSPSMAPVPQYAGQSQSQAIGSVVANQQYYLPQHPPVTTYYTSPLSPLQAQNGVQQRPSIPYYAGGVLLNQQSHPAPHYYYAQHGHYVGQPQGMQPPMMPSQYISSTAPQTDSRFPDEHVRIGSPQYSQGQAMPSSDTLDTRQSIVRGPPRKPRQSGHAIWIGNLPPQAELMSLVHHVCKEAAGLESLFLISKSNCAFANFKDDTTCVAAQQKLHDSKFQSVRLVSRLRKSTVEGATGMAAPTGPAAASVTTAPTKEAASEREQEADATDEGPPKTVTIPPSGSPQEAMSTETSLQGEKFFVLKSLTVEDLELSVRTGIWATQSHNEETLNNAFNVADNVYLVFSANKSGEYFGYARMTSSINEDPTAAIEFAPSAQAATDPDLPKAIPTEATEHAPKGRIIDDSARGTIFWEADRDDIVPDETGVQEEEAESGAGSIMGDASSVRSGSEAPGDSKAWGKPFKLEWLSTTRLPFYRTRGLRNPWNSNREVKIARDGTELEPSVGRRLIGLFHRDLSQAAALAPGGPGGVGLGAVHVVAGYAPMRPTYRQPQA